MVQDPVPQQPAFSTQFQEFHVNPATGSNTADGTAANPFQTITHALQQVSVGSTAIIRLNAGVYSTETGEVFPLIIPPQTSILGNVRPRKSPNRPNSPSSSDSSDPNAVVDSAPSPAPDIVICGGGSYNSPIFGTQNVAIVLQDNALLREIGITNPNAKGTGIWIEDIPGAVTNCQVFRCGREGIFVTGMANPVVTDCVLQDNQASGITFTRNARGEIRRSMGQGNLFGMVISDRAAPFIVDNQFVNNRSGIVLSGVACPVLRNNRIVQNQEDGLAVFQQAQPDLGQRSDPAGNIFQQNGKADLRNATSISLFSIGNQLNFLGIQGEVNLQTSQLPVSSSAQNSSPQRSGFLPIHKRRSLTAKLRPITPPFSAQLTRRFIYSTTPPDTRGHWAEPFIHALLDRKAIDFSSSEPFHPDAPISRDRFTAWLAQTLTSGSSKAKKDEFLFAREEQEESDRENDEQGNDEQGNSEQENSEQGNSEQGDKQPETEIFETEIIETEKSLTRGQAILALVNHLGINGANPDELALYRDRSQIPNTAIPAVAAAIKNRLVVLQATPVHVISSVALPTLHDRLTPMAALTRAEAAAMLYQGLVWLKQAPPIASPHIVQPTGLSIAFSDVQHHWAADFIRGVVSQGIMGGSPKGQFEPDRPMTRAEYAVILAKMFEPMAERSAKAFSDVVECNDSEKQAIEQVYRSKLMGGFADGTFRPNQPITRVQVLLALVSGLKCPTAELEHLNRYVDRDTIPDSARPAVATATAHWLVVNYPRLTQLQPNRAATRAEVAAMVYQALVQLGRSMPLASIYLIDPRQPNQHQQFQSPIVVAIDPGHGGLDYGVVSMSRPQSRETAPPFETPPGFPLPGVPSTPSSTPSRFPPGLSGNTMPPATGMPPQFPGQGQPPPFPTSGMPPGIPPGMLSERLPPIPIAEKPPLREKEIVLPIAHQIGQHLAAQGIGAILTRPDDRYLDPAARAILIDRANADLLISLHVNGAPNQPDLNGLETYYFSNSSANSSDPNAEESSQLAHAIHAAILDTLDIPDRGVHTANFHLLRRVSIPVVHIEMGYLTGEIDATNLKDPDYCTQMAKAIANGVLQHIRQLV
jgi:parallel beta-helix repeat protein